MISVETLQQILDSLVGPKDRDFTVEFSNNRSKRFRGRYDIETHTIRIFLKNRSLRRKRQKYSIIVTGIHELAHHLTYEACRNPHDPLFWIMMGRLIERAAANGIKIKIPEDLA